MNLRSILAVISVLVILLVGTVPLQGRHNMSEADPLTRHAYEHFYNLDYDTAIADFQKIADQHGDDPFAINHLLAAILFRELYRADALDTTVYSRDNSFLNNKVAVPIDRATKARIEQLGTRAISLAESRLQANPNDVDALYARGVTRGIRSTYLGIAEKSWFTALRNALGARRDHERVLELDPGYSDAKTVVGVHNYVIASLPLAVKMMAGMVGLGGNREKGISYLRQAAAGNGETSVDARVALGLFLRREGRAGEALEIAQGLSADHSRNYLFALEVGNLQRESGQNDAAVSTYRKILAEAKRGRYFSPHLEFAYFGLGSSLKGDGDERGALEAYSVVTPPSFRKSEVEQNCVLHAGQMLDLLDRHAEAVKKYQQVISEAPGSSQAELARHFIQDPPHHRMIPHLQSSRP